MQNHVRNKMTASKPLCEKQQLALFHLNIKKHRDKIRFEPC